MSVAAGVEALLEDVVAAQVVVETRREAIGLGDEEVALGGVEVAARGVGAERPAAAAVLLPRRDPERELEEGPHRRPVERARRDRARGRWRSLQEAGRSSSGQGQLDPRGAGVGPERLRLVGPVEEAGSPRVAPGLVRAPRVVAENRFDPARAGHSRSVTGGKWRVCGYTRGW